MKNLFSLVVIAAVFCLVSCKKNPPVVANPCSTDSVPQILGTGANGPDRTGGPMSALYRVSINMNYVNIGPEGTIVVTVTAADGSVFVYPKIAPHTGATSVTINWAQIYSSVAYPLMVRLKGITGVVGCSTEVPYGEIITFAKPAL